MKLSKTLILFFFIILTFACTKEQSTESAKMQAIKSATSGWIIEGFTSVNNTPIDPALFTGDAKFIKEFIYKFQNDGIVRSFDKVSTTTAGPSGTWGLIENDTKLDININGSKGIWEVIELSTQKMILQNKIKINNVETPVNMVFVPIK
jgi:hypothetical protein